MEPIGLPVESLQDEDVEIGLACVVSPDVLSQKGIVNDLGGQRAER